MTQPLSNLIVTKHGVLRHEYSASSNGKLAGTSFVIGGVAKKANLLMFTSYKMSRLC